MQGLLGNNMLQIVFLGKMDFGRAKMGLQLRLYLRYLGSMKLIVLYYLNPSKKPTSIFGSK